MIYYGNIARNVYFGNGGTNQRFHNIPTSPIILDFCVFLREGGGGYRNPAISEIDEW